MDLKSSLEIIINESEKKKDIELHQKILENIIAGDTLSDAIRNTGEFTPFEYFNIKIGEETGKLEAVLDLLNKYFSRVLDTRQKIRGALTYPILIVIVSVLAVFIMMKFVVPTFADVYNRLGHDLPAITNFVLKVSQNLGKYFLIVIILGGVLFILGRYIKKSTKYLVKFQQILLKIPLWGAYLKHIHIEKFFHSLSILLQSKINLVQSFEILAEMTNFLPLKDAIISVQNDLISGNLLSESLKKYKNLFDSRKISLIKVGEEVNKLDFAIKKIEAQLEEKTDNIARNFTSSLEPALIIFVGFIVGVILIAMYMPIFKLSSSFF
jgi:type IV pilus assembly protein PilC